MSQKILTKSVIFSLLVFSSLFLTQCKNDTDNYDYAIAQNTSGRFIQITGYIRNRDFYPNTNDINMIIPHVSGENRVSQIEIPINDDGTFYFTFYLPRPQEVIIEPYLKFLYLMPGDSLHIEIDFKNLSDIRLSGGKSAEINNEFHKYFDATGYRTSLDNYGVGTDCEMNCSWDEIIKKFDEERDFYRNRRQTFLQKNKVYDEVAFLTEAMIELDYYKSLVKTWSRRHYTYLKEVMDQETLVNEVNEVAVKYFSSNLYSDAHFKFIGSAYIPLMSDFSQQRLSNTGIEFVEWAKEVTKTDIIKEFMMTTQAGKALLQKDLEGFEIISSHVTQEYLIDRLMQEYSMTRMNMLNPENISVAILGIPSGDFTGNLSLGNENILAKIVAPNYGKVHVLDICATWCPGCINDLDLYKTLMEEYADKDVQFSIICHGPDNERNRAAFQSKGIDDTLVHFCTDDEYLFLSKKLFILSYPQGILVNRKGVIVDNGPHVRPGEALRKKIDLLLEQDKLIK